MTMDGCVTASYQRGQWYPAEHTLDHLGEKLHICMRMWGDITHVLTHVHARYYVNSLLYVLVGENVDMPLGC